MEKTVVAIYLRKSRSDEGLDALRNHKAVLIRLAEQNGFSYEIYEEIGSSVSLDARESLNEMLANIYKYKYVLVMDLDRLARSIVIMEEIKEKLKYHGVLIMTPQQTIDLNNETNEMMMDFQSVIAKAEYQQIRKRMRIGKLEGARQGHWVNGVAPLGYSYDKTIKKLAINEQEYPLVREIYSLALKNMSYSEIAINLNLRGYRTRLGNTFTKDAIKTILTNRAYVGDVVYRQSSKTKGGKDEVIITHNSHPAIVSESDWLEVQRLIQNKRTHFSKVTSTVRTAVQGIVYCGCCGTKLTVNIVKNEVYIKGCWKTDAYGQRCSNRSVKAVYVEKAVFEALRHFKESLIVKVRNMLKEDNSGIKEEINDKIKSLKADVKKQEIALDKLLDSYLESLVSKEEYTAKKKEREDIVAHLKQDIRRYELQLEALDSGKQVDRLKQVIRVLDNFESLDVREANRFLQSFIEKIEVTAVADKSSIYRRAKAEPVIEITFGEGV